MCAVSCVRSLSSSKSARLGAICFILVFIAALAAYGVRLARDFEQEGPQRRELADLSDDVAAAPLALSSVPVASVGGGMSWPQFLKERSVRLGSAVANVDPSATSLLDASARSRVPVGSVQFLEFPSVSAAALPLFNVSLLYRTALIREKPRHCFIPVVGGNQEGINASSLASQLHLVSNLSPDRIPTIPLCHEDQLTALGEPVPPSGPHATYDVGFLFDGERCSTNMWHGLLEVVVPLIGARTLVALRDLGVDLAQLVTNEDSAYRRSQLTPALVDQVVSRLMQDQRSARHVLLMKAPRKNIWGVHNLGCPILNHYPYGWSTSSVSGWLLYALFDPVSFGADGWPRPERAAAVSNRQQQPARPEDPVNTLFFGETPTTNKKYEMRLFGASRTVFIKRGIFYGPSSLCRWSKAYEMPPKPMSPPYYLHVDPLCPFVYDVTKRFALAVANITETEVTIDSLSCPKVGVVVRRSLHNGRGIRNFDELVATIEAYVATGGPTIVDDPSRPQRMFRAHCGSVQVVNLEGDVPYGHQIRLVNNLDIVIGARGMGLTNAIFMKRNAGLLVLSGREIMAGLNVGNDNYPWNPLHALRSSNAAVLSSCPVVFPSPDSIKRVIAEAAQNPNRTASQETATYAKRCVTRSVNFCDMRCDVAKVVRDLDRLVFMMKALLEGGQGPSAAVEDVVHISDRW